MSKSIGIIYVCTGPYYLFWKDFYKSFEEKFLQNTEKRYFVFTDAEDVYGLESNRVQVIKIENQPWPLITLLRFNIFLRIEEELRKCDYLMFSNANMVCGAKVTEEEFLPRNNETIFVTLHPGYYEKSVLDFPYDRNPGSLAYVPWNCGKIYVIGAMFGGNSDAFIEMSHRLKKNIAEDLKKNIIARWHDESHLNHYIIDRCDVRALSPSYCYPCGMNVSYEKKIYAVSKQEKFDVKTFKGNYEHKSNKVRKKLGKIKRELGIKEHFFWLYDSILNKRIKRF